MSTSNKAGTKEKRPKGASNAYTWAGTTYTDNGLHEGHYDPRIPVLIDQATDSGPDDVRVRRDCPEAVEKLLAHLLAKPVVAQ